MIMDTMSHVSSDQHPLEQQARMMNLDFCRHFVPVQGSSGKQTLKYAQDINIGEILLMASAEDMAVPGIVASIATTKAVGLYNPYTKVRIAWVSPTAQVRS